MVRRSAHEDDAGDAMHPSADREAVFPVNEGRGPEGMRELESETGDDQDDEADHQKEVLPALAEGEANLAGVLTIACKDHAGLAPQVDEVVQQHGAEGDRDDDEVEELHVVEDAAAGGGSRHDRCV